MYLATTRLREFWPDHRPIVLLGDWCLPEGKLSECGGDNDYTILPYPWDNRDRFEIAAKYVQNVYEHLLIQFAAALNDIHGLNKSVRYWRIIIGPWLSWYLEAFYDRYICLLEAIQINPNIVTVGLESTSYVTPHDFNEFVQMYLTDEYNLMLYTQILEVMGIKMLRRSPSGESRSYTKSVDEIKRWHNKPKNFARRMIKIFQEPILRRSAIGLVGTGLSSVASLKLCIASHLRIAVCNDFGEMRITSLEYLDEDIRGRLKNALDPIDEFETVVIKTISRNIPKAYIETFTSGCHSTLSTLNRFNMPKILVSAMGWYGSEAFKIFAAEAQENGTKLVSVQHGGYYGMLKYMSPEIHEQKISDRFYSWGWTDGLVPEVNVKVMPSLKLVNSKILSNRRKKCLDKHSIILVTTKHPRYLYRFQSHPVGSQWKEYFQWEFRFVNFLKERVKDQLKVRLYPHTYGWGIKSLWQNSVPKVTFDQTIKIQDHFSSASMLIIDNPSTTFLEAFAADVPTVLFWNPLLFSLRNNVQPYFDELRKVGILHDTPESAAIKVNEIYENPESWWQQLEIQNAKDMFNQQFACTSEDWLKDWRRELLNLANR